MAAVNPFNVGKKELSEGSAGRPKNRHFMPKTTAPSKHIPSNAVHHKPSKTESSTTKKKIPNPNDQQKTGEDTRERERKRKEAQRER